MTQRATSDMTASSAQICRDLGWVAGTVLQESRATCGADMLPRRIRITAVGEQHVLGVEIFGSDNTDDVTDVEDVWNLKCRDWELVR